VARVAAAVRDVPPAASRRHGVSDARTGDSVREGCFATACRDRVETRVSYMQQIRPFSLQEGLYILGLQVLIAVTMKSTTFSDVTP
jgi:hypothetical protein